MMNTHRVTNPVELLAQSDLLLLLADLLRSPLRSSTGRKAQLALPTQDEIATLIATSGLTDADAMLTSFKQTITAIEMLPNDLWQDEHHRLFEGAMLCPLNETFYIRRDKGVLLGDLSGFYHAFGWQSENDQGEKQDHITTELEFIAILLVMAAHALQVQHVEHYQTTLNATALFAENHLGDWLPMATERLSHASVLEFHHALVQSLAALWRALIQYHQWIITPPPESAELFGQTAGISADPENPYECAAPGWQEPVPLTIEQEPTDV